jgi:hypothetical protein
VGRGIQRGYFLAEQNSMMSSSSFPDIERHTPVRIDYSRARQKFAKGGLAKKAEDVRGAGRMGDDMVVHVNKREFEEMRRRWGEPTINPHTKMPEFFLGDLFGGIGDLVTTGASYIPVVGESASGWLSDNPWAAQALGSGLLGAGAGQLLGGNTRSTLLGGALGALAPMALGGASPFGALSAGGGGGGLADKDNVFKSTTEMLGREGVTPGGALSDSKRAMAGIIGALTVAQLVGGASRKPNAAQRAAEQQARAAQEQFNKPLPAMTFNRAINPYAGNPLQYGFGGPNAMGSWFSQNQLPRRQTPVQGQFADGGDVRSYARGGALSAMHVSGESPRYVQGPGGAREDKIPALLSNNEYVLTAEDMALLGDGSPEDGARKMDQFRENLRRHKGGALSKGKISPDAKSAHQYIGGKI